MHSPHSRLLHQLRGERAARGDAPTIPARAGHPADPVRAGVHRVVLPARHAAVARIGRPGGRSASSTVEAARRGVQERHARGPPGIHRDPEPVPGQGAAAQGLVLLGHREGHRREPVVSRTVFPRRRHADHRAVVRREWHHILYPAGMSGSFLCAYPQQSLACPLRVHLLLAYYC